MPEVPQKNVDAATHETQWLDDKLGEALKESLIWHEVAIQLARTIYPEAQVVDALKELYRQTAERLKK